MGVGTPDVIPSQVSVTDFEVDSSGNGYSAYNLHIEAEHIKLRDHAGYGIHHIYICTFIIRTI